MKDNSNEMIDKAKNCQSPEELIALAKKNGVELTGEQAESYFKSMHENGELSDEELNNVSGGGCGDNGGGNANPTASMTVTCNTCGRVMPRDSLWLYTQNDDGTVICEQCESGQIQGDIARAYDMIAERNR